MITPSIQRFDWLHKPTVGPPDALKRCRNLLHYALSALHTATALTSCGIPTITTAISLKEPSSKSNDSSVLSRVHPTIRRQPYRSKKQREHPVGRAVVSQS